MVYPKAQYLGRSFLLYDSMILLTLGEAAWPNENRVMAHYWDMAQRLKTLVLGQGYYNVVVFWNDVIMFMKLKHRHRCKLQVTPNTLILIIVPTPPRNVTLFSGNQSINVSWISPAEPSGDVTYTVAVYSTVIMPLLVWFPCKGLRASFIATSNFIA